MKKAAVVVLFAIGLFFWALEDSRVPEAAVEPRPSNEVLSIIEAPTQLERHPLAPRGLTNESGDSNLEQSEAFVKFLHGFGKPIIGADAIRSSWGGERGKNIDGGIGFRGHLAFPLFGAKRR